MSLDYVSNQEIIQAARRNLPQDVWDYLTGGAESETTMRRNRLGFDCLGFAAAGAGGCFQGRYVDDIPGAEAAYPSDDGAHRFAANDYARGRRRGGESGRRVRHHEFRQLRDSAEVWKTSRPAPTIRKFFSCIFAADWIGARRSSGGSRKPATSRYVLRWTRRTIAGASGHCSTAGSRRAEELRPAVFIRRCSHGKWRRRSRKSPACR